MPRERQEERRRKSRGRDDGGMFGRALRGFGAGARQGLTLGFGDELFADSEGTAEAMHDAPVAFSVGSAIGALPWATMGARIAGGEANTPIKRLLASGGLGALHGGAAGAGGMTPGDLSSEERFQEALAMAALGGGVGAFSVPATRASLDTADNLPALLGRVRDVDTERLSGIDLSRLGQGTRASAPLNVRLAGEGGAEERAAAALQSGLGMDEFAALQRNAPKRGGDFRGAFNRHGEEFTPFDEFSAVSPRMADTPQKARRMREGAERSRATRSVIDFAAQSPGGKQLLTDQATDLETNAATRALDRATLPRRGTGKAALSSDKLEGMLQTLDEPRYHAAWVRQARQLPQQQRHELAQAVVAELRQVGETQGPAAVQARIADRQLVAKLEALGVGIEQPNARSPDAKQARSLRERAEGRPSYSDSEVGFRNMDDRHLASRAPLSEEDAIALLRAAMSPRRGFYTPAIDPASQRMLTGEYERGAKFSPQTYFSGADDPIETLFGRQTPTELAIMASQPAAALLHGVPSWFDREEEDPRDLQRRLRELVA